MMDDECHTFASEVVGNHTSRVIAHMPQSVVRRNVDNNHELDNKYYPLNVNSSTTETMGNILLRNVSH